MANAGSDTASLTKIIDVESKKITDVNNGIIKIREQLESDRKTFCVEFRKSFAAFAKEPTVHKKRFKCILDDFD